MRFLLLALSASAFVLSVCAQADTGNTQRVEIIGKRLPRPIIPEIPKVVIVGKRMGGGNGGSATQEALPPSVSTSSLPPCSGTTFNPVIIATGEKYKVEEDFVASGYLGLSLVRTYRSINGSGTLFGRHWLSNHDGMHLDPRDYFRPIQSGPGVPRTVVVTEQDGTKFEYQFLRVHGGLESNGSGVKSMSEDGEDVAYTAVYTVGGAAATGTLAYDPEEGWKLRKDNVIYSFDNRRLLTAITTKAGAGLLEYKYSDGPVPRLESVSNAAGQTIILSWGEHGLVSHVQDPAGKTWAYDYHGGALTKVTAPGDEPADVRSYHYENADQTLLTGMSFNGERYSTYGYYADRRVQSSALTGEEEKDSFSYGPDTTTVTDARGQVTNYQFRTIGSEKKLTDVTREQSSTCPQTMARTHYNDAGYVDFTVDFNGNTTRYRYDAQGRLERETTASGSPVSATKTHKWGAHGIDESEYLDAKLKRLLLVNYDYYQAGRERGMVSKVTLTDTASVQRHTGYAYTFHPVGNLASQAVTQHLPAGPATTTTHFDSAGNVTEIVNALQHSETWRDYDALGRAGSYVDNNGVETRYTYNPTGTLATIVAAGGRVTRFHYNHRRQPTSIAFPSGQLARYKYNAAGRVEYIGDALENHVHLGLAAGAGSVSTRSTKMVPTQAGGTLSGTEEGAFTTQAQLNSLGRPYSVAGNKGQRIDYRFDSNGNITTMTDGTGRKTVNHYNAQDMLESVTAPDRGTTRFRYDSAGGLEYVIDPREVTTQYGYNDFGEQTKIISPDTGQTQFKYDTGGRVEVETRADGKQIYYEWDALGRLRSRTSGAARESYRYDEGDYGKGRLTGVSDATGTTDFRYNAAGQLVTQINDIYGTKYTTLANLLRSWKQRATVFRHGVATASPAHSSTTWLATWTMRRDKTAVVATHTTHSIA